MNFAFPALLVFLLVLPGIVLRYTYARGPWGWASPTSMRRVSEELAYGVAFALVLHALWLALVRRLGFAPDVEAMVLLLVGNFGEESRRLDRVVASVAGHYTGIAGYLVSLYAGAAVLGNLGHRAVRRLRLDHLTKTFRFDNYWFYMLTGEVLDFRENAEEGRTVDGVYCSAVVDHASGQLPLSRHRIGLHLRPGRGARHHRPDGRPPPAADGRPRRSRRSHGPTSGRRSRTSAITRSGETFWSSDRRRSGRSTSTISPSRWRRALRPRPRKEPRRVNESAPGAVPDIGGSSPTHQEPRMSTAPPFVSSRLLPLAHRAQRRIPCRRPGYPDGGGPPCPATCRGGAGHGGVPRRRGGAARRLCQAPVRDGRAAHGRALGES